MNKDQVKGRANEAAGKVKQAAADIAGKPRLHDEGKGQEMKGKIQKTFGDLKRKVGKAIDR